MTFQFLTQNEQNALHLEDMYSKFGYHKYKVNRFEEYSFYMENESFLTDRRVLTFSGPNGKLLALKPDITTSIVKNCRSSVEQTQKVYYNESVFRIPKGDDEFKEIHQTGVECIGHVDAYHTTEVLYLAVKSLETINSNYRFCLSNTALLLILMNQLGLKTKDKTEIIQFMKQKNVHDLNKYLEEHSIDAGGIFGELLALPSSIKEGLPVLEQLFSSWQYEVELGEFKSTLEHLASVVNESCLYLDFSHIPSTDYYKGLVFAGYLEGLSVPALTGGRYDNLLEKMGMYNQTALGFAVDLSATHSLYSAKKNEMHEQKYTSTDDVATLIKSAQTLYEEGKTFQFTL